MPAKGSCDPAPDLYHVAETAKGNGTVLVTFRYGWNGTDVFPDCSGGPLLGARVENTGTQTWYVHLPRSRGGWRTISILPGSVTLYTSAQLSLAGLLTRGDLEAFDLSDSPTPPQ